MSGSHGEHYLQEQFGTMSSACAFYNNQVLDYLNPQMCAFIAEQEMVFIATASADGECDNSFRAGQPGFVQVLNDKTLIYPEFKGNGVMASMGNIVENSHIGLLFIDFFRHTIGLHVNGRARIIENDALVCDPEIPAAIREALSVTGNRRPTRWVMIDVEEAYIHCSKHIPKLQKLDKTIHWGTDDVVAKGGDFFQAKKSPRYVPDYVPEMAR
jgi:uncharacterized protein